MSPPVPAGIDERLLRASRGQQARTVPSRSLPWPRWRGGRAGDSGSTRGSTRGCARCDARRARRDAISVRDLRSGPGRRRRDRGLPGGVRQPGGWRRHGLRSSEPHRPDAGHVDRRGARRMVRRCRPRGGGDRSGVCSGGEAPATSARRAVGRGSVPGSHDVAVRRRVLPRVSRRDPSCPALEGTGPAGSNRRGVDRRHRRHRHRPPRGLRQSLLRSRNGPGTAGPPRNRVARRDGRRVGPGHRRRRRPDDHRRTPMGRRGQPADRRRRPADRRRRPADRRGDHASLRGQCHAGAWPGRRSLALRGRHPRCHGAARG